jgi:hypothetical protein
LKDIPMAFEQISKDIRHRYTIGFVPDEQRDTRTVRSVRVVAARAGQHLTCKTRTTFRIPPVDGKI